MTKKKNSAMKKLIPATSMLLVSATMLTASTYAWFTMSREVEVTGIKMTAVLPADIQISLGDNTGIVQSGTTTKKSLNVGTISAGQYGLIKYSNVVAPDGATGGSDVADVIKNTTDWYNTVDFSQHYVVGKLKPVSSTDGNVLFKTSDAILVGKDVSKTASFTQVGIDDRAGLYCIGSLNDDTETIDTVNYQYVNSADDNKTGEDKLKQGYYVDFPVWFRTSTRESTVSGNGTDAYLTGSPKNLNLGVSATIKQRTASDADSNLYHAVRIAVLEATGSDDVVTTGSEGIITNKDDTRTYYDRYSNAGSGAKNGATNVKASDMTSVTTMDNQAVYAGGNLVWSPNANAVTNALNLYGSVDKINQVNDDGSEGESVVSIPLPAAGADYGYSGRYVIRIWLEGEDIDCWNETAGQDWDISLKFVKLTDQSDNATKHGGVTSYATPETNGSSTVTASTTTAVTDLAKSATLAIAVKNNDNSNRGTINIVRDTADDTATPFKVDSVVNAETTPVADPNLLAGSDTKTYALVDGTTFANLDDLVAYLNKYDGKYKLDDLVLKATS